MQEIAKIKNIEIISVSKCYQNLDNWQKDRIEGNLGRYLGHEKGNPENIAKHWSN